MPKSALEQAILQTIRYFSLFAMPLTAVQLWRCLIVDGSGQGRDTVGFSALTLRDLRDCLATSPWLTPHLGSRHGYYFLKNQDDIVTRHLERQVISAMKWQIIRRMMRWLRYLPFVAMIAVSGSVSLNNAKPDSDLDLLIIARRHRLWTARLCLLVATQLVGRRRKHWDKRAPDKICLNHYVSDAALTIASDNRTIYTAMLYHHLIPLTGFAQYHHFMAANPWLENWLRWRAEPFLPSAHARPASRAAQAGQALVARWLLEPVGDVLEQWSQQLQRRAISKHTQPGRSGRIMVSSDELAFHPDSKAFAISEQFQSLVR